MGKRLSFAPETGLDQLEEEAAGQSSTLPGGTVNIVFTTVRQPMAAELTETLKDIAGPDGMVKTAATLKRAKDDLSAFFGNWLDSVDPEGRYKQLSDVDVNLIDAFDAEASPRRYGMLGVVIRALKTHWERKRAVGEAPSAALVKRLSFISAHKKTEYAPRDSIPVPMLRQMRAKALGVIRAATWRIRAGRRLVNSLREKDPTTLQPWERIQLGIVDRKAAVMAVEASPAYFVGDIKLSDLHWNVHLSEQDCMAFIIALGTSIRVEYECLRSLTRGCLEDDNGRRATLTYRKGRRPGAPASTLRVDSRGTASPGGLIRLAHELSNFSAECLKVRGKNAKNALWCGYSKKTHLDKFNFLQAWQKFFAINPLIEPSGKVIEAPHPGQMRKSIKREEYRRALGHVKAFASDHTEGVAVKHYASIPSLHGMHEDVIAEGLSDAFSAAMAPLVLTDDDVERALAGGAEMGPLADNPDSEAILRGDADVWLASCANLRNSPFGTEGDVCPSPIEMCLLCRNAVITSRKLPNILRFKATMENERSCMGDADWRVRYEASYQRIMEFILPRFPADVIAAAGVRVVNGDDGGLDVLLQLRGT